MALTLTQLRQLARARYGLAYSATEDATFSDTFLTSVANEVHHWLAAQTECYYDPALSISLSNGTAAYALGVTVIRPDERTFRYTLASAYTRIPRRQFASLLEQHGPLEDVAAAAAITGFYLSPGAADSAGRQVVLVPKPNASGTLKYGAWVYPAALSADGDQPELQDAEHYRLLSGMCWKMAEFERARGRSDAPVEMWAVRALDEALELREIIRRGTAEFPRGMAVPGTVLEQVAGRRGPLPAGPATRGSAT